MRRNITISYILSVLFNAYFWIGIWLIYYFKFTDYTGAGILGTIWLVISLVGEVPTGAIADIIGKRYTLILASIFNGIGYILMGTAKDFNQLVLSIFIMSLGGILQSGAYEAITYDSLKQINEEDKYSKVLSNQQTISLVTMAISSVLGGFIYKYNNGLPFILTGTFYILAFITSLFLKEPYIDTETFSWSKYIHQTKQGIKQLFNKSKKTATTTLLIIGSIAVILYEHVDDALVVEFGFRNEQLGIFYAILLMIASLGAQLTPWIKKKFGIHKSIIYIGIIFSTTLMSSPFIYFLLGGLTVYIRGTLNTILENITSEELNKGIPSKYRATTLSTFSMLKLLPYALSAIMIGHIMDKLTARVFSFYLGLIFLLITVTYHHITNKNQSIR